MERKNPDEWEALLASRAAFAAFAGPDAVGLAAYVRNDLGRVSHRAHLINVWVDPAHRGTGLADRLIGAVETAAAAEGVLQLELEVNTANKPAISFYHRLGYETIGRMPRAFRSPKGFFDDFIMVKQLGKA